MVPAEPNNPVGPVGIEATARTASVSTAASPRPPFPVAVAPWLEVQLPGTDSPVESSPLPVADAPLLVISLPEGSTPRPIATTAELASSDPDQAATAGPREPAVPAGTEGGPVASPADAPAASAESGTMRADLAPADADASPAGAAATTPGTLGGQPATPGMAQSFAHAAGQAGAHPGADDSVATARDGSVAGIGATARTEEPALENPLARTQASAPLHRQLLGPIATLAAGPNGERTLSVNIAPEALGPITVRAHLGEHGIRMELSAPTDAGREALRAMLPELRRELAATGSGAISVATDGGNGPGTGGGSAGSQNTPGGDARPFTGAAPPAVRTRDEPSPETPGQDTPPVQQTPSHLDVMA